MKKLILKNGFSPGDIVMLTAAVRDLHRCHPRKFLTDVRTPCPDLWDNNPHLTSLDESDPDVTVLDCVYPLIIQIMQSPNMFRLFLIAVVPLLSEGCTVLTCSQVKELNTFATVADNYGTLPGDSIRTYGQATRFDRMPNISARNFPAESAHTEGWGEIEKALDVESCSLGTAAQADAAFDVLDDYTAWLKLVSSDEFTTEPEDSTKQMGTSFDKGIGVYNDQFRLAAGRAAIQPAGVASQNAVRCGHKLSGPRLNRRSLHVQSHAEG